ncbi:MAG: rRNA pseudouridine synthase [Cyclobacteriaceae bacterium]|nr:rRNA pseudouridine synthase [Cyclobacteriaceae bacterium]
MKTNPGDKKQSQEEDLVRLNKYISNSGICSRRDADKLIANGEVTVNNKVITELGYKISPKDDVSWKGKPIRREKLRYILLNKPKDFITTMDDERDRRTVMQLVANACSERIYPVGRLDRTTTGLLLFTNDGDLTKKLTHPSGGVKKVYKAELNKPLTKNDFQSVLNGTQLEDGLAMVDELNIISADKKSLGIRIHMGKNRIIHRIFEHYGYYVDKLDRVMFAGLDKKDLPRGKWRHLTETEVRRLKYFL